MSKDLQEPISCLEMKSPRAYPLVCVEWADAALRSTSWFPINSHYLAKKLDPCFSAGWMVHRDQDQIVVVSHISLDKGKLCLCAGAITIPEPCIIHIETLKLAVPEEPDAQE